MHVELFAPSGIPFQIHESISRTASRLIESIEATIKPKPNILNILWHNNLLDADLHITPWMLGKELSNIAGLKSEYFQRLTQFHALPFPRDSELQLLAEYALRCSHTTSAVDDLIRKNVPNTIGLDHPSRSSLIRSLLWMFRDLGAGTTDERAEGSRRLEELKNRNQLLPVIHTLLGMLPQYSFATGARMSGPARVVKPEEKYKGWKESTSVKDDPATAVFVLLSLIESLQWSSDNYFYVIPNLFRFLAGEDSGSKILEEIDTTLLERRLYLEQLSLYFTADASLEFKGMNLVTPLRKALRENVDTICGLAKSMIITTYCQNLKTYDELQNWVSKAWLNGMLMLSTPTRAHFFQEYLAARDIKGQKKGGVIRLEGKLLSKYDAPGEPSLLLRTLLDSWGIYREVSSSWTTPPEVIIQNLDNKKDQSRYWYQPDKFVIYESDPAGRRALVLCEYPKSEGVDVGSMDPFVEAYNNLPDSVATVLQRINDWSCHISTRADPDWYKSAFGRFYYELDKIRHENPRTEDFTIRKARESDFYWKLLKTLVDDQKKSLRVLDIGIGYGRLEKRLLEDAAKHGIRNVEFYGLDLSHEMRERMDEYLAPHPGYRHHVKQYLLGEMVEVADIFHDQEESFDAALLAFSTFGCYYDDESNARTLCEIAKLLRPGGLLIIEQCAPLQIDLLKEQQKQRWPYLEPLSVDGRTITLLKTAAWAEDSECVLYSGDYFYLEELRYGTRLIRKDGYCLRLYRPDWFTKHLGVDFEPDVLFCADFQREVSFQARERQEIMCCVAKKPAHPGIQRLAAEKILLEFGITIATYRATHTDIFHKIAKKFSIKWEDWDSGNLDLMEAIQRTPPTNKLRELIKDNKKKTETKAEGVEKALRELAQYLKRGD